MAEVMPSSDLEQRDSDVPLPPDLFLKLPPFHQLKSPPSVEKFPGSVVLRRYRKGEVICRQGAEGWSAFYLLGSRELLELRAFPRQRLAALPGELADVEKKLAGPPEKQPKDQLKKRDALQAEVARWPAVAEMLEREIELPADQVRLLAGAGRALAGLQERRWQAENQGDKAAAQCYRGLFRGGAQTRAAHAAQVAESDPELARWLQDLVAADEPEAIATVLLSVPRHTGEHTGVFRRLARKLLGRGNGAGRHPAYIPNDGPVDLDYDTREATLRAGELFGEMSCLYRTRRSATVVAARDCYVIEMLRNILDKLRSDAAFKARLDDVYRSRVLGLQLRQLPLLADLDESLQKKIGAEAELIDFPPGTLICDEHDTSDCMYLIRSGVVKVVKNTSFLLSAADVDPAALALELTPPADDVPGPRREVWDRLPESARALLREGKPAEAGALATALNELIKDPHLADGPALGAHAREAGVAGRVWRLLAAAARANECDRVRCNRQLMELCLPANTLPPAAADPEASLDLRPDAVANWKTFCTNLAWEPKEEVLLRRGLAQRLEPVRAELTAARAGRDLEADERARILAAVNGLIDGPALTAAKDLAAWVKKKPALAPKLQDLPADPAEWSTLERRWCNRLVLAALYPPGTVPEWEPGRGNDALESLLRPVDVTSWRDLCAGLTREPDAKRIVWDRLPEAAQDAIRDGKAGKELDAVRRAAVTDALNDIQNGPPLMLAEEFQDLLETDAQFPTKAQARLAAFLPQGRKWTEFDYRQFGRAQNRFLLEALFPKGLRRAHAAEDRPLVLAYQTRGEFLGEMGLLTAAPRSATCVAYNHPENDPEREVGPVQLVRVGRRLFQELQASAPSFKETVEAVARQRRESTRQTTAPSAPRPAPLLSPRAEELGLVEGQRLMLIDLDRCTRCDECVRACVNTHADGRTRLFLDGPRFGHYLVPLSCRSCLDPVCMIGCPVGSIHRGDNQQIIIEDWCIGCGACAKQCPYGSIQMHDLGLIPESAVGWRVAPEAAAGPGWEQPRFKDHAWAHGRSPFSLDRDLHDRLRDVFGNGTDGALCFRYAFNVPRDQLGPDRSFRLDVTSADPPARVWLNGVELKTTEKAKRGNLAYVLPITGESATRPRPGANVLAVRATPPADGGLILSVRLDPVPRPEAGAAADVTEKLVKELAVVCDLCSTLPGRQPACVHACPHDAAMRVDARVALPAR